VANLTLYNHTTLALLFHNDHNATDPVMQNLKKVAIYGADFFAHFEDLFLHFHNFFNFLILNIFYYQSVYFIHLH
jgi:hypothetical protein